MIVTDNATCFASAEFKAFLERNGVKHVTSAPYYPSFNGLADRAFQILKNGLKKVKKGTLRAQNDTILCTYRITPHSTTGVSPAELLMGRRLHTRLGLLKPNIRDHVDGKQIKQKEAHDVSARVRRFSVGDTVFVHTFGQGERLLKGKIVEVMGPVSYHVQTDEGNICRCHQDQILFQFELKPEQSVESKQDREEDLSFPSSNFSDTNITMGDLETAKQRSKNMGPSKEEILTELVVPVVPHLSESQSRTVRTSSHVTRPPNGYQSEQSYLR